MKKSARKVEKRNFNPLFMAFISGILLVFLGLVSGIFSSFFPTFSSYVFPLLNLVLSLIFLNGFYFLGKKYDSKLLRICCCIFALFSLLFYFSGFIGDSKVNEIISPLMNYYASQGIDPNTEYDTLTPTQQEEITNIAINEILPIAMPYLIVLLVLILVYLVFLILFGVSLIKLKDKIDYAKVAGILGIVSAGLFITILGIIVGFFTLAAMAVFELIILFNESKKLE